MKGSGNKTHVEHPLRREPNKGRVGKLLIYRGRVAVGRDPEELAIVLDSENRNNGRLSLKVASLMPADIANAYRRGGWFVDCGIVVSEDDFVIEWACDEEDKP